MKVLPLLMMFFMGIVPLVIPWMLPDNPTRGVTRTNYGVDFVFMGRLHNSRGHWRHAWVIDLALSKPPPLPQDQIRCSLNNTDLCVMLSNLVHRGRQTLWESTKKFLHLHEWQYDPTLLATFSRLPSGPRPKKALLPFIGTIEKYLFGTATEDDVRSMHDSITTVHALQGSMNREILRLGKNLASMSKTSSETFANTNVVFKKVSKRFREITSVINENLMSTEVALEKEENQIQDLNTIMKTLAFVIPELLGLSEEVASSMIADVTLARDIQEVLKGYLPMTLVSPDDLRKGLRLARDGIQTQFPHARLIYSVDALGYYYTHQIVTPMISGTTLTIMVDVPIDLDQQFYDVYKVHTFPLSLKEIPHEKGRLRLSQLANPGDNFLVARDLKSYAIISNNELARCKGDRVLTCSNQFSTYTIDQKSCLQQIWFDSPFPNVMDFCTYKTWIPLEAASNTSFISAIMLTNNNWFIQTGLTDAWTIKCPGIPPIRRDACSGCEVRLDCGCSLAGLYFDLPAQTSHCEPNNPVVHHNATLNPFQYLKDDHPWIINVTGTSKLYDRLINASSLALPPASDWDDVMQPISDGVLSLNRLYRKQKNETFRFKTTSDALMARIAQIDMNWTTLKDWPEMLIIVSIVLTFCNSAGILVILSILLRKANAANLLIAPTTPPSQVQDPDVTSLISLDVVILIITIFNSLLLIFILWPILGEWIHRRVWKRRLTTTQRVLKAVGYTRRVEGVNLIATGTLRFSTRLVIRAIGVKILLACLPPGWHIADNPHHQTRCSIELDLENYVFHLQEGITVVSATDGVIAIDRFYVGVTDIHNILQVPVHNQLVSFEQCSITTEGA